MSAMNSMRYFMQTPTHDVPNFDMRNPDSEPAPQCSMAMRVLTLVILSIYTTVSLASTAMTTQVAAIIARPVAVPDLSTAAEKIAHHLQAMAARTRNPRAGVTDFETERAVLIGLGQQLRAENDRTRSEFAAVAAHLRERGLPESIQQRHHDALQAFEQGASAMEQKLTGIANARDMAALRARMEDIQTNIGALRSHTRHQGFDPHRLPFGAPKFTPRTPRTRPEQFAALTTRRMSEQPLWASTNGIMLAAAAVAAATPADLAATEDVQITPDIQALAAQLNHNPVAIQNWVYNNIAFVPTYGSIQGSAATLQTLQGNAFDTSSLLIALLRASNIPARYVFGTVDIPMGQVMNWLGGLDDPQAALNLLGQGGIPATGLATGGTIVTARMEHVWVEAYVDFKPSRGAVNRTPGTWVPMDGSFKQFAYSNTINPAQTSPVSSLQSLTALQSQIHYDPTTGMLSGMTSANTAAVYTEARSAVNAYFDQAESNGQDIFRDVSIQPLTLPLLPSGLPYHVVASSPGVDALPSTVRRGFQISVYQSPDDQVSGSPVLSYSIDLPQLAGQHLSLQFQPTSAADQATLQSFLPAPGAGGTIDLATLSGLRIPGYLVHLDAVLLLNDSEVARATGFILGQEIATTQAIQLVSGDWYSSNTVNTAGQYLAISLDLQGFGGDPLDKVIAQTPENLLHEAGRAYWANLDDHLAVLASTHAAIGVRQPSFGLFATNLETLYNFGVPTKVRLTGVSVDVHASLTSMVAFDGDPAKTAQAVQQNGLIASALESQIPQAHLAADGTQPQAVSAVSAIMQAVANNQPLFQVNSNTVAAVLPLLQQSPDVLTDVQNAVGSGEEVLIPQSPITLGGWTGAGYIILDPTTGSGAYRISGGLNGGSMDSEVGEGLGMLGLGALHVVVPPVQANSGKPCGQQEQEQLDWKTMLALAVILALLATLLVLTSGAATPAIVAVARAISAVLLAFAPLAAAQAQGGVSCAEFHLGTIAASGDMSDVNAHVAKALAGTSPSLLTYTGPIVVLPSRAWLDSTPECDATARKNYVAANNTAPECDEYPFYRTWQGGQTNYAAHNGKVSLQLVRALHNSRAGGVFGAYVRKCGIYANMEFKVSTVQGISSGTDRNGKACYP
jgi:transglutaminase-like putative cysteine protease